MEEIKKQATIKGKLVPCPRFSSAGIGAGSIDLKECIKCEYHQGIELVREADPEKGYLQIDNVKCNLPTMVRISYHIGDVD